MILHQINTLLLGITKVLYIWIGFALLLDVYKNKEKKKK